MSRINESIASFFDALTGELQRRLSPDQVSQVAVSWDRDSTAPAEPASATDLTWWSCALSVDPACILRAGADRDTWKDIGGESAADAGVLTQSIQQASKTKFGALVSCSDLEESEAPPAAWLRVPISIAKGDRPSMALELFLSPDLFQALGGEPATQAAAPVARPAAVNPAVNPLDILQHVEVPVSVSFGRTRMMLKDLLALSNGSLVHLDRELGDVVEVRVNNCVIARGEVVAVDGNYGVRILELASAAAGQGVRGILRGS